MGGSGGGRGAGVRTASWTEAGASGTSLVPRAGDSSLALGWTAGSLPD